VVNKHRVVVWSTGGIGSLMIGAIHRRQDLELVGVWVHSDDKVGRDAGELAFDTPIGLAATNDAQALIDLRPDCVVYAASGPERDAAAVPDYVRLLEAGINVVTTTSTNLINPTTYDPAHREQLESAAQRGGASIYASGIEPGFVLDQLVLMLTTQSKSIRSIHASELGMYDDYAVVDIMSYGLGFGQPMDSEPFVALPGVIVSEFQAQIRMIADALGVELDEIREEFDRRPTDTALDVAFGKVDAGTCGAIRMRAIGRVAGRDFITIDHVTRLSRDVAPDWPIGDGAITYRIVIDGDPDLDCALTPSLKDPQGAGIGWMSSGAGAMLATAMRVVNAVPYVVAAPPGLVGSLDLPLTLPRDVLQ